MATSAQVTVGPGFFGLLAILFIGLKLTGYIDWSWWWVALPLWAGLAVGLSIIFFMMMFIVVVSIASAIAGRRSPRITMANRRNRS